MRGESKQGEGTGIPVESASAHVSQRKRGCISWCTHYCGVLFVTCVAFLIGSAALQGRALNPQGVFKPIVDLNFLFMRLARDKSRAKARERRFGQKHAMMSLLKGTEEALPLGDPDAGIALTAEELAEFDGRLLPGNVDRAPLFLAILGRIYDVTAGHSFYGPGKSYHKLVGRDASRAFCTGCLEDDCLISSLDGLSPSQLREADKWIELYEHHDK